MLVEIRCPFEVTSKKSGHTYPCNRLCVKVSQGTSGEAYCASCKKQFDFEIAQGEVVTRTG